MTALLGLIVACSTDPATLNMMRVEGQAYDIGSSVGIEGVQVALRWSAGAFGHGTSHSAQSDVTGRYVLAVNFDPPALCDPGVFDLVHTLPSGFEPLAGAFEPLECVEAVQIRDLAFVALGVAP